MAETEGSEMEGLTFQDWFWDHRFWLPENVTWADLEGDENTFIPKPRDLWMPLPIALGLFLLRLVWERFIALPIGRYFEIRETPPRKPVSQPVLEVAFKKYGRILPNHKEIEVLCKKIEWVPRQVERWWRRRRVQHKPSEMQRWRETSWRFIFYLAIFWYGVYVLHDKHWFYDTKACWYNYPKQHVTTDVWAYYMIELGFYFSLLMSLFMDTKRKDHVEQMIHHFCTICLLAFSFASNCMRIGCLVLLVHDVADPVMEGAKLAKYAKYHKLCDALFIIFTVIWFVTRLCIYPFRVLNCAFFESVEIIGPFVVHRVFNGMLLTLQILHIYWFYLILRMVRQYIVHGQVEKDERSETEPETNSEDDDVIAKEHANGFEKNYVVNNNVKARKVTRQEDCT